MTTWYVKYRKTLRDAVTTVDADSHDVAVALVIEALGKDGDVQVLTATDTPFQESGVVEEAAKAGATGAPPPAKK